jgi:Translationally controlled tumour protein
MRLAPTTFDKKSYLTYVKGYMKKLKAKLVETHPERVEAFEKGAQAYVKKVIASFKDWEYYTGESMDTDGMVALLNYRDDGVTPYIVFFKDGLEEIKLVCLFFWVGANGSNFFGLSLFFSCLCGGVAQSCISSNVIFIAKSI